MGEKEEEEEEEDERVRIFMTGRHSSALHGNRGCSCEEEEEEEGKIHFLRQNSLLYRGRTFTKKKVRYV